MGVKVREKRKGSGEWWIYIDHKGQRKAKKFGRDKKEANKTAKKIEAKLVLGDMGILENEKQRTPTLKEYVYGWEDPNNYYMGWFAKVAELKLKNSTRLGYRQIIDTHLIPAFGSKHLDQINTRMIYDFLSKKLSDGLRSYTVKNIKNCFSAILKHAHSPEHYIESNPANGIIIPRPEDERPSREPNPFTWEEKDHFEKVVNKYYPKHYPLILCGLRTGLRIGELIALKWEDLNFDDRLIFVQRNITKGKITTPKYESGKRHVRMSSQLIEAFKQHRTKMKEDKLRKQWKDLPEWVFYNENGGYLNYGNFLNRVWNRVMDLSELSRRTPHDLRHTYATLRLSKGDSLAEVSKEMGHSKPEITYRYYYKWLPKESYSNIDELDDNPLANATNRNLYATKK